MMWFVGCFLQVGIDGEDLSCGWCEMWLILEKPPAIYRAAI